MSTKQANGSTAAPQAPAPKLTSSPKESASKGSTNTSNGSSAKGKATDSRLEEFFHDELKDIYWAENHLVKTLPKMVKAASGKELKNAFTEHLSVTKGHVTRLDKVFDLLGYKAEAKKCEAMDGITKEGESIIEDTEDGTATRDAGLIMAGQKVEHYEIATYGALARVARTLGHDDVVKILESTLAEEKKADQSLTDLAESTVNEEAAEERK
jgi:ferritin-like metal-binding protein YciE